MIVLSDLPSISIIILGLFLGGLVKGAAGAGMPIVAVPVIAYFYDVRLAVILLVIPNFFTNVWQIFKFKDHNIHPDITMKFVLWGMLGAGVGTVLLAYLPVAILSLFISLIVFIYVGLRLLSPNFSLALPTAKKLLFFCGGGGGLLQGAVGLSSPIVLTFLHTMGLPRKTFIFMTSVFFCSMSLVQIPMQVWLGLLTWWLAWCGLLALIPIMIGFFIGGKIGKRLSQKVFNNMIMALLTIVGISMFIDSLQRLAT